MGGVEGAGVPPFAPAGMGPRDQFLCQLGCRHPGVRSYPGILIGELGPEPGFANGGHEIQVSDPREET
jgi:hypothetical protein